MGLYMADACICAGILSLSAYRWNQLFLEKKDIPAAACVLLLLTAIIEIARVRKAYNTSPARPFSSPGLWASSTLVPSALTALALQEVTPLAKDAIWQYTYLSYSLVMADLLKTLVAIIFLSDVNKLPFLGVVMTAFMYAILGMFPGAQIPIALILSCSIVYSICMHITIILLPCSFTLGEAGIISQCLALLATDCIAITLKKWTSSVSSIAWLSPERDMVYLFLFALIWGMLLIGLTAYSWLKVLYEAANGPTKMKKQAQKDKLRTKNSHRLSFTYSVGAATVHILSASRANAFFYLTAVGVVVFIILPWMWLVGGHEPFQWTILFVFSSPLRLCMIVWWVFLVAVTLLVLELDVAGVSKLPNIIIRKIFHFTALLMFVPCIMEDLDFMALAFAVATSVFILGEYIRVCGIWPLAEQIQYIISKYADERDAGPVVLTHLYLLVGCAIPVWMSLVFELTKTSYNDLVYLAPFAGVIALGVGDSLASVVGSTYGQILWPGRSRKTLEGSVAAFVSQLITCSILLYLDGRSAFTSLLPGLMVRISLLTLLEAATDQLDNLILPIALHTLLLL